MFGAEIGHTDGHTLTAFHTDKNFFFSLCTISSFPLYRDETRSLTASPAGCRG